MEPTPTVEPAATPQEPDYQAMLATLDANALRELCEKASERELYLDHLKRKQAELENLQKRAGKDRADWTRYANRELLAQVLPILDNLQQTIAGLGLVEAQFQKVLVDQGVEPIEAAGKRFDPRVHEAVMQEEDDTVEDMTVLSELLKGYRVRDRVLRPSRVKVSRKPARRAPEASPGEEVKPATGEVSQTEPQEL